MAREAHSSGARQEPYGGKYALMYGNPYVCGRSPLRIRPLLTWLAVLTGEYDTGAYSRPIGRSRAEANRGKRGRYYMRDRVPIFYTFYPIS